MGAAAPFLIPLAVGIIAPMITKALSPQPQTQGGQFLGYPQQQQQYQAPPPPPVPEPVAPPVPGGTGDAPPYASAQPLPGQEQQTAPGGLTGAEAEEAKKKLGQTGVL